jgi:hypothetical protein
MLLYFKYGTLSVGDARKVYPRIRICPETYTGLVKVKGRSIEEGGIHNTVQQCYPLCVLNIVQPAVRARKGKYK